MKFLYSIVSLFNYPEIILFFMAIVPNRIICVPQTVHKAHDQSHHRHFMTYNRKLQHLSRMHAKTDTDIFCASDPWQILTCFLFMPNFKFIDPSEPDFQLRVIILLLHARHLELYLPVLVCHVQKFPRCYRTKYYHMNTFQSKVHLTLIDRKSSTCS